MDLISLIFPRNCLNCNKEGSYLCQSCLVKCRIPKPVCPYCEKASIDGMTHSGCKTPLSLDGLTSIWNYEGVVRKAILALKYKFATDLISELADKFTGELITAKYHLPPKSVLVPIPLFWYRKNWRGFNQSEEIGKIVAKRIGWQFTPNLLIRKRLTTPQAELKAEERSKNIQGVFSINPTYQPLTISHQPLILFDDVWTTGSTMKEATKVLKRAGAQKVWGLTIAR